MKIQLRLHLKEAVAFSASATVATLTEVTLLELLLYTYTRALHILAQVLLLGSGGRSYDHLHVINEGSEAQ